MSAEHSPLPWHVEMRGPGNVVEWIATPPDSSGFTEDVALIVSHDDTRSAADAALIVRAVNNFDALVEALDRIVNRNYAYLSGFVMEKQIHFDQIQHGRDLLKRIEEPHSR